MEGKETITVKSMIFLLCQTVCRLIILRNINRNMSLSGVVVCVAFIMLSVGVCFVECSFSFESKLRDGWDYCYFSPFE